VISALVDGEIGISSTAHRARVETAITVAPHQTVDDVAVDVEGRNPEEVLLRISSRESV
jgi:hypothetical protein